MNADSLAQYAALASGQRTLCNFYFRSPLQLMDVWLVWSKAAASSTAEVAPACLEELQARYGVTNAHHHVSRLP